MAKNWAVEDWTGRITKSFCYDDSGQAELENLVIIISNSEYRNRNHVLSASEQPKITVSGDCQSRGFICRFARRRCQRELCRWCLAQHYSATATVSLDLIETTVLPGYVSRKYEVTDGEAAWETTGHVGQCEFSRSGSDALTGAFYVSGPPDALTYSGLISIEVSDTALCPGPNIGLVLRNEFSIGCTGNALSFPGPDDSLTGSCSDVSVNRSSNWSWDLTPASCGTSPACPSSLD